MNENPLMSFMPLIASADASSVRISKTKKDKTEEALLSEK